MAMLDGNISLGLMIVAIINWFIEPSLDREHRVRLMEQREQSKQSDLEFKARQEAGEAERVRRHLDSADISAAVRVLKNDIFPALEQEARQRRPDSAPRDLPLFQSFVQDYAHLRWRRLAQNGMTSEYDRLGCQFVCNSRPLGILNLRPSWSTRSDAAAARSGLIFELELLANEDMAIDPPAHASAMSRALSDYLNSLSSQTQPLATRSR